MPPCPHVVLKASGQLQSYMDSEGLDIEAWPFFYRDRRDARQLKVRRSMWEDREVLIYRNYEPEISTTKNRRM